MKKHFNTSVYVYNPILKKYLFIKHKKIGKWLQPGGHIEENENPEDCALREVKEETGLEIQLIGKRFPRETDLLIPYGIQKNIIENNKHEHFDIIYFGITNQEDYHKNIIETDDIKWLSVKEILNPNFNTFEEQKKWIQYFEKEVVKDLN